MKFDFGVGKARIIAARGRLDALLSSQLAEGCRLLFEKEMVTTLSQLNPSHTLTPCSFNRLKPEEGRDQIKWRRSSGGQIFPCSEGSQSV
jgi:hypothetical protein